MIKLRVDDETAIPLSVDSSSAVSMTVSEAFIDRGGSAIQNNKNATPSTSQVVVTPDPGFDGMAKVTVAAMPQGEIDPASLSYDTHLLRGRITAEANVTQAGYVPIGGNVARAYCDELLPSENPKTVTPTTSEQTAVDANKWTKGQIKVGPIPPEYIVPSGTKSISANGTGIDVKAYEKVDVAVPGITPSGTLAIATNGSHDVTNYATASVAVPASAVDSGTKSITANGNGQDVVGYAAVNVNVPNSYAAADEGKVVSNGALVAQTSDTVTQNGTVDTTLINSLLVNVQASGGRKVSGSFTIASDTNNNNPTITHNFGTKKIAAVIYPVSIAASGGYHMFYFAYIAVPYVIDAGSWSLDFTPYNSAKFPDVVTADVAAGGTDQGVLKDVSRQSSPWTTQSTWYAANNESTADSSAVLTDDTIKPSFNRWAVGTYKYIVFDLS